MKKAVKPGDVDISFYSEVEECQSLIVNWNFYNSLIYNKNPKNNSSSSNVQNFWFSISITKSTTNILKSEKLS